MTDLKPTILLVDDDPNDEEFSRLSLEETNLIFELIVCRDGAEALEWLKELRGALDPAWPRFVMLDLKLPKVGGLEVLEQVRADGSLKTIPIIVFTSSSETRDLNRSYELGANAYVRKPVDFTDYRQTVGDLSRFWFLRNKQPAQAQKAI